MKDKIRFLFWNKTKFGVSSIVKKNMDVKETYTGNQNIVLACIRELHFKLPVPFKFLWYNKSNKNYDGTFIISDAMMTTDYLNWLVENNPNAKFVFWYWNKITSNKIQPDELKKMGVDVWSFNMYDCKKYDIKLNHTYYCEDYYEVIKEIKEEGYEEGLYDLSFVGKDKGRMEYILDLEKMNPTLKFFIHIVPSHFYLLWKDKRYKKSLPYKTVLKKELESKAILEIVPEGSQGMTIRTMDAICMGKKLITNNSYIKQTSLYNANNIFVLDEDENLVEFINKPYIKLNDQVKKEYLFESWLERFIKCD